MSYLHHMLLSHREQRLFAALAWLLLTTLVWCLETLMRSTGAVTSSNIISQTNLVPGLSHMYGVLRWSTGKLRSSVIFAFLRYAHPHLPQGAGYY